MQFLKDAVILVVLVGLLTGCSRVPAKNEESYNETDGSCLSCDTVSQTEITTEETENPPVQQTERYGFVGGNIAAGGFFAGDGAGTIYFRSEADRWALCAVKVDGTGRRKLCDDMPCLINVLDGWVYFSNASDGFSIYRIRDDGTQKEKLIDGYCCNLHVTSEGMYYDKRDETNKSHAYHAALDGTDEVLLVPNMNVAAYHSGILYCRTVRELATYDLMTGVLESVCSLYTHNVYADKSGVYYWAVDKNEFHHVDRETKQTTVLYGNAGGNYYNFANGNIYVTKSVACRCIVDMVDAETRQTKMIAEFSDSLFDYNGNTLDISAFDYYTGNAEPDPSLVGPDGIYNVVSEDITYIYAVEGLLIGRGQLPSNVSETGRIDCLIELTDGTYRPWIGDVITTTLSVKAPFGNDFLF